MPSLISYKVPVHDHVANAHHLEERKGKVAWLHVGRHRVKFVLQHDEMTDGTVASNASLLVHYASGIIVGKLHDIRLRRFVANPYGRPYTDRELGSILIGDVIDKKGPDWIIDQFALAKVVNK